MRNSSSSYAHNEIIIKINMKKMEEREEIKFVIGNLFALGVYISARPGILKNVSKMHCLASAAIKRCDRFLHIIFSKR